MKLKQLLLGGFLTAIFFSQAQCPQITCPGDITVTADQGSCDAVVTFTAPQGIDPCATGDVTFTNCGISGQFGPTQNDVNTAYSGGPLDNQVTVNTQGIQEWTVPYSGSYTIEIAGASGGDATWSGTVPGGLGATMIGEFNLTAGDVLQILVGQQGESDASGGGGGGTFVILNGNPIIVAGGGGGASTDMAGLDAVTGNDGTMDSQNLFAGGTGGNGGNACMNTGGNNGGAGGGYQTDGASPNSGGGSETNGYGGLSFLNGGIGGEPGRDDGSCTQDAFGGFGGGGSTTCNTVGGGGGGGYSGGAGGPHINQCGSSQRCGGGGGGSYNVGANQNNTAGSNSGDGYVNITWSGANATTTQTAGLTSGSAFPVGTTVQTFETTDGNGNTATCSFNVIVTDDEAPVADVADLTDVEEFCEVTSLTAPTATDNCEGTITGVSNASFPITSNTTVTWTYTDGSGNATTQDQNIIITGVDVNVTTSGITMTADNANADSYQWINCQDNGAISGATSQSYTATANGDYAVIITEGNCTDTSDCQTISTVDVHEQALIDNMSLFPNPNNGQFTINFGQQLGEVQVSVHDLQGRVIEKYNLENIATKEIDLTGRSGAFMIHVATQAGDRTFRVVVQE